MELESNNNNEQQDTTAYLVAYLQSHLGLTEQEAIDTLNDVDIDEAPDPIKRFEVKDMNSANWVLRQIAEAQKRIDELTSLANDEIERIQKRLEQITKPLKRKAEFFSSAYNSQLEEFTRRELEGSKSKSLNLIHGKIGFRKNPDKVVLDVDEDEVIQELKRKGKLYCIRTVESIKHNEFAKTIPELAPGFAHIEPGEVKFYIKAELPE